MRGITLVEMGSIVPIVIALLLFFGSVPSATNIVEEKNAKIDLVFSLIQIVDRITESGIVTKERFQETLEVLKQTVPQNFFVCITDVDDSTFTNCSLSGGKGYKGTSVENIAKGATMLLSSTFPVVVQEDKGGVPFNEVKKMLVVVWLGG